MAALNAKERNLDDLFLSDVKGNILETSSSNVFVVSNGVLYTPGLDEGCLAGTMRMQVINLALKCGMKVYECSILPQNLLAADEVFITNAVRGINWIGSYRTKKFSNTMARKLIISLNELWRNKLEN
jgi:branched-chain amino acid aminotransferase